MTRPTAKPDMTTSQYTRESGRGEAGRKGHPCSGPDAPIPSQETTMLRIFTTAAVLALTNSAAQAGPPDHLATRIHDAAKATCAKAVAHQTQPVFYYNVLLEQCIDSTSKSATAKYQALAATAARAKLAGK